MGPEYPLSRAPSRVRRPRWVAVFFGDALEAIEGGNPCQCQKIHMMLQESQASVGGGAFYLVLPGGKLGYQIQKHERDRQPSGSGKPDMARLTREELQLAGKQVYGRQPQRGDE